MGEAEGRKEAHEGGGTGGNPPVGLHGGPARVGRGVTSARDRRRTALLTFAGLGLWPLVGSALAWRAGETGACGFALAAALVAALPSIFFLADRAWAGKVAEAFALAGMVLGILFVLRFGLVPAALPAAGYFLVFLVLTRGRLGWKDAATDAAPAGPPLAWLKENVEAIAVAFIMALVIRGFCVEVFKIPSSSMEPTLLGDSRERSGDRIIVTKLTYFLQAVSRFEPLVFKFPLNPMKNYIKRVVGLPREKLVLVRGNVYTKSEAAGDATFMIRRKPLHVQRSVWIDAWPKGEPLLQTRETFAERFTSENATSWNVRGGVLSGGAPGKDLEWFPQMGISDGAGTMVNEILWDARLSLTPDDGEFWVEIKHDFGPFRLKLRPRGGSGVTWGTGSHCALATDAFPAGSVRVEFMVFDGLLVVMFNGRIQAQVEFQQSLDQVESLHQRNGLSFGARGIRFELADLRVGRDIHYLVKGNGPPMSRFEPLEIGDDEHFMLGDNVNNSHDGRAWKKYTARLTDGRVIEYESQAFMDNPQAKESWARRHGKPVPDYYVEADINGHEQAWTFSDCEAGRGVESSYPFVKGKFIIGRAFAVCWPIDRLLKLIR